MTFENPSKPDEKEQTYSDIFDNLLLENMSLQEINSQTQLIDAWVDEI